MKCNNCGTEHESKFCPNCGEPAQQNQYVNSQQPAYGQQAAYQNYNGVQTPIKQSGMGITALVLCATGCLGIIGLIIAIIDLAKKDATKKHTCSKIAIGIFIVYIILGVALGTNKKDNATVTTSNNPDTKTTMSEEIESVDSIVSDEDVSVEEVKEKYSVGDTWTNDFVNVSYLECGEYKSDNQFMQPKDNYKYVYATFEFENVSDSDQTAMAYDFSCYADGYACDSFFGGEDAGFSETLSAGRKIKGTVYFEVPKDAKEIEIEYDTNFWTSENIIFTYSE